MKQRAIAYALLFMCVSLSNADAQSIPGPPRIGMSGSPDAIVSPIYGGVGVDVYLVVEGPVSGISGFVAEVDYDEGLVPVQYQILNGPVEQVTGSLAFDVEFETCIDVTESTSLMRITFLKLSGGYDLPVCLNSAQNGSPESSWPQLRYCGSDAPICVPIISRVPYGPPWPYNMAGCALVNWDLYCILPYCAEWATFVDCDGSPGSVVPVAITSWSTLKAKFSAKNQAAGRESLQ